MRVSERERRDWALILIILLLGILFMCAASQAGLHMLARWNIPADMHSRIDIQRTFEAYEYDEQVIYEQVLPAVLTPLPSDFLTPKPTGQNPPARTQAATPGKPSPEKSKTPATVVVFTAAPTNTPKPTNTLNPTNTSFVFVPSKTNTKKPVTNTRTDTPTLTRTPSMTFTLTRTGTAIPTSTNTATPTPTFSPSPTLTSSPTFTLTLSPTFTLTPSQTPSLTTTPTLTLTPSLTMTPSMTLTTAPSYTPTPNTEPDFGQTDGFEYGLSDGSSYTFFLGTPITIDGDSDYDLVYYEIEFPAGGGTIHMDQIQIEIGDGTTWYTVFYWGDGWGNPNTNLNIGDVAEPDNYVVSMGGLYGSPHQTGILINVDGGIGAPPVGFTFDRIRLAAPTLGSTDGCNFDAIQVLP
jgi:hypothetical protein